MTNEKFILELSRIGAIKFGKFTLKSGIVSPFYIDLRDMISHPDILEGVADLIVERIKDMDFDVLTGIPYTALPIASLVASKLQKPLVYMRKEEKAYGTGKNVIGTFEKGAKCLVIDDLITTGESKIETAKAYEKEGVVVKDFVVVIDRIANGTEELARQGYTLHSLMTLDEILDTLFNNYVISKCQCDDIKLFTAALAQPKQEAEDSDVMNPLTRKLHDLMMKKQSNLILSLDVSEQDKFFSILEAAAPEIVMLKTHVDIIENYTPAFIEKLQALAEKHEFLIFEDRKFADIGNTVRKQYREGVYKIADWAEFVTVHVVPGEGILKGLFEGIDNRSSFILARMSSKGNLINETYTRKALAIGKKNIDVVSGFIGHGTDEDDIRRYKNKLPAGTLLLMPGVKLEAGTDALGQQYVTVEMAVRGGADCIIVGRGIYGSDNPGDAAKEYRKRGWKEYYNRINK